MSGKLDQSLDEILSTSRRGATRTKRGGARPRAGKPATTVAPVGGVRKNTAATRGGRGNKAVPTGPAAGNQSRGAGNQGSKVVVSNLVCYFSCRLTPYYANMG